MIRYEFIYILLIFFCSFYITGTLFHEPGHYLATILCGRIERIEYKPIYFSMHFTYSPAYRVFSRRSLKIISISGLISQIIFHIITIKIIFTYYFVTATFTQVIMMICSLGVSIYLFIRTKEKEQQDCYNFFYPETFQKNLSFQLVEKKITYIDITIYIIFLCCLIKS